MYIIDKYKCSLRFRVYGKLSQENINKYAKFKLQCENGNNGDISKAVLFLSNNNKLNLSIKPEGGFHMNYKEINYREYQKYEDDILFYALNFGIDRWKYTELDNFIHAFTKVANDEIGVECIRGYIELE
jgi:hypothetical protein